MLKLQTICVMIRGPKKQPLLERRGAVGSQRAMAILTATFVQHRAGVSRWARAQQHSLEVSNGRHLVSPKLPPALINRPLLGIEFDAVSEPFGWLPRLYRRTGWVEEVNVSL